MNYQKIYDSLMQKQHLFIDNEYFEVHHKLPKSLGGTDEQNNLVRLTAREHYIAHLLLVNIHKSNSFAYGKMLYAFNCMRWGRVNGNRSFKFNSRLYQALKKQYSQLRKTMMKKKTYNPALGKIWIHSDSLHQSKLWDKVNPIPSGWQIGRVTNWNSYFDLKILKEHRISGSHLSQEERQLFNEHKVEEIIRLRELKKKQKEIELQNRVKQVQEIADYYSTYGFYKTKQKYIQVKGVSSLESMLGMFSHYKKYGLRFQARNNIKGGQQNGSWFLK